MDIENDFDLGTPEWAVREGINVLLADRDRLQRIERYVRGYHDKPYIPDNADDEFTSIVNRSIINYMPLILAGPTQTCFVDSIRHGVAKLDFDMDPDAYSADADPDLELSPEMQSWQDNRMDVRQTTFTRGLSQYGVINALTRRDKKGKVRYEAHSPQRSVCLFEDWINGYDPDYFLIHRTGRLDNGYEKTLTLYDAVNEYDIEYTEEDKIKVTGSRPHGNSECPGTRMALQLDLEGRPLGLIEPCIEIQDQINQTNLDMLVVQTYGSFKVKTVTGMAPPFERWTPQLVDAMYPMLDPTEDGYEARLEQRRSIQLGSPVTDSAGRRKALPVNLSAKRVLFAEDPNAKWGTLDETPLDGYIAALAEKVKHLFAISQTPSTYNVGEMANLSAEALQAAEIAKRRRDDEIRMVLGEGYERMLRLGMELLGETEAAADQGAEVVWRDTDPHSRAAISDALAKDVDSLEYPIFAAWEELPGMTQGRLMHVKRLWKQQMDAQPEAQEAAAFEAVRRFSSVGGTATTTTTEEDLSGATSAAA